MWANANLAYFFSSVCSKFDYLAREHFNWLRTFRAKCHYITHYWKITVNSDWLAHNSLTKSCAFDKNLFESLSIGLHGHFGVTQIYQLTTRWQNPRLSNISYLSTRIIILIYTYIWKKQLYMITRDECWSVYQSKLTARCIIVMCEPWNA